MIRVTSNSVLVVPPFECAWLCEELRFKQPGEGCVTFEARADNDVTVVFKEESGSRHYRTDSGRHYTVVLGSHRNKRMRIEVDGQPVVDVPGTAVSSTQFERYWIDIRQGVITVGKGDPGQAVVYQWTDAQPNCGVQYVGLSSWDKFVGYRNIRVLPTLHSVSAPSADQSIRFPLAQSGFGQFLNNNDLADVHFTVGSAGTIVHAHRVILAGCCPAYAQQLEAVGPEGAIALPAAKAEDLIHLLKYVYLGAVTVQKGQLSRLEDLGATFGLTALQERIATAQEAPESDKVELRHGERAGCHAAEDAMLAPLPLMTDRLLSFLDTGQWADVALCVAGQGEVVRAHRVVLSAWSAPMCRMFTNGMQESRTLAVTIHDTSAAALQALVRFMYCGRLALPGEDSEGSLLLPLLVLADRYQVRALRGAAAARILELANQDSACAILQVAAALPGCEALQRACEETCATCLEYLISPPSPEFLELDYASVAAILQHPQLSLTSEERVLDAVLLWGARGSGLATWQAVAAAVRDSGAGAVFRERFDAVEQLLPLVHFPIMAPAVLQQLWPASLVAALPCLQELVREALQYQGLDQDVSAQHRRSYQALDVDMASRAVKPQHGNLRFQRRLYSYKELLYICDGDTHGVCHFAGTSYGQHPWMNPVVARRLTVTPSSPPSRYTDGKLIVSRNYTCTSYAGPCYEDGHLTAWWKIDLGEEHQLMCNYYTLRQDGSANFLRTWKLQGSLDGGTWTDLRVHSDEATLSSPGQYGSWPISGPTAALPFRMFRVLLTGPSTSKSKPWNLCLCYVELYGYFR